MRRRVRELLQLGVGPPQLVLGPENYPFYSSPLIALPVDGLVKTAGMALMATGLTPADPRCELALTGPFRHVRHPIIHLVGSIIAIGFFLGVLNLMALVTLLIIPARSEMADAEEDILGGRVRRDVHRVSEGDRGDAPEDRKVTPSVAAAT